MIFRRRIFILFYISEELLWLESRRAGKTKPRGEEKKMLTKFRLITRRKLKQGRLWSI